MATDFEDERARKTKTRRKVGRAVQQYHKNLQIKAVRKARVGGAMRTWRPQTRLTVVLVCTRDRWGLCPRERLQSGCRSL